MKRILFLCNGNYYRSRFAEIFFNWHAEQRKLRWRAESRGLALVMANPGPMSRFTVARLESGWRVLARPALIDRSYAFGAVRRSGRRMSVGKGMREFCTSTKLLGRSPASVSGGVADRDSCPGQKIDASRRNVTLNPFNFVRIQAEIKHRQVRSHMIDVTGACHLYAQLVRTRTSVRACL